MNHKVLLADDSLTIQKVIKITLANQPFDIVDCISDEQLFQKLPEVQPELVFLDFNLSEKYTGYELTSKIKSLVPNAKVLLLLGTFDTVDEAAMEKCGASDKVVKPFDSNKFIAICKRLVDTSSVAEIRFPETSQKEEYIVPKEEEQWTVNHTVEQQEPVVETKSSFNVKNHLNPLDQEVSDWGMSVPGVINDRDAHEKTIDLPPVIEGMKSFEAPKAKEQQPVQAASKPGFEQKFPEENDLDYPTIEELTEKPKAEPAAPTKAKLISIETFNQPVGDFEIEHGINSMEETDVSSIEAQIRDEVEEDLWKVDEFEDLKKEVSSKIEEMKSNFQPSIKDFDESLFKPIDDHESIKWDTEPTTTSEPTYLEASSVAPSMDRSEMEELIKKYVKEYMDQMFQKQVEKISWEVIPDLAENLIRQELSKISNKILNDSN